MLTWENMIGWEPRLKSPGKPAEFGWRRDVPGRVNRVVRDGRMTGIVLGRKDADPRTGNALTGTMCIAAESLPGRAEVSVLADFDPASDGAGVWTSFAGTGILPGGETSRTPSGGEALGAALAVGWFAAVYARFNSLAIQGFLNDQVGDRAARSAGHEVLGLARGEAAPCDLTDRRAVAKRVAEAAGATWVPFQTMFDGAINELMPPAYWAGDGVHPTMAGHALMAKTWLDVTRLG